MVVNDIQVKVKKWRDELVDIVDEAYEAYNGIDTGFDAMLQFIKICGESGLPMPVSPSSYESDVRKKINEVNGKLDKVHKNISKYLDSLELDNTECVEELIYVVENLDDFSRPLSKLNMKICKKVMDCSYDPGFGSLKRKWQEKLDTDPMIRRAKLPIEKKRLEREIATLNDQITSSISERDRLLTEINDISGHFTDKAVKSAHSVDEKVEGVFAEIADIDKEIIALARERAEALLKGSRKSIYRAAECGKRSEDLVEKRDKFLEIVKKFGTLKLKEIRKLDEDLKQKKLDYAASKQNISIAEGNLATIKNNLRAIEEEIKNG